MSKESVKKSVKKGRSFQQIINLFYTKVPEMKIFSDVFFVILMLKNYQNNCQKTTSFLGPG